MPASNIPFTSSQPDEPQPFVEQAQPLTSGWGDVDRPPEYIGAGVAGPYPGMPVIDAEGARVGQVVEKQGDMVKVSRPNQPDLTVPLQAASVENNVMVLEVPARDLEVFGGSS